LEPLARRRRGWRMIGGPIKRDYAKLCAPKWRLAERDQTPSLINGPAEVKLRGCPALERVGLAGIRLQFNWLEAGATPDLPDFP
jgi:hypothetical protein